MDSPNNTSSTKASKKPVLRFKWDQLNGIRTILYVLHTRFSYWNAIVYARILNHMFKDQLAEMGFKNGIDNNRISREWREKEKDAAKDKWAVVMNEDADDESEEAQKEARNRDRWEALVKIAAKQIGLEPEESEDEGEEDDGQEGEDLEEDEAEMERYRLEGEAFRRKHTEQGGKDEAPGPSGAERE